MTLLYKDAQIRASWGRNDMGPYYFPAHTHVVCEVLLFLEGKATFCVEGSEYTLAPGDVLVMRPLETHFIKTDPNYPYERIVLNFDTGVLRELDPESILLRPLFQRELGTRNHYRAEVFPDNRYQQYLKDICDPGGSHATAMGNLILFLQILDRAFGTLPSKSSVSTVEQRIMTYIHWHLDKPMDIEYLCSKFYISRTQLCRRFREITGMSVGKYILTKRMAMAQQLIRENVNPSEACQRVGYKDYSAFFRAYKAYFGHGPKQERNCPCAMLPGEAEALASLSGDA